MSDLENWLEKEGSVFFKIIGAKQSSDAEQTYQAAVRAVQHFGRVVVPEHRINIAIGGDRIEVPCLPDGVLTMEMPHTVLGKVLGCNVFLHAQKLAAKHPEVATAIVLEELFHAGCHISCENLVKAMVIQAMPWIAYNGHEYTSIG